MRRLASFVLGMLIAGAAGAVAPAQTVEKNWGDEDGRTLYLTAQTGLYRIRLNVPGSRPL